MSDETTLPTADRVRKICNDLYRQTGKRPSVRTVLSMMPDITSTSTVHGPLKEWWDEIEASEKSLYDKLGFSPDFSNAFMKEITRFSVEAETRYKDSADAAKEQRDVAIEDLERTEEKYYKQSALVEQQAKEIRSLKVQLAEAEKAHGATVNELRQQLAEQSTANKELAATNESLRTDIAKISVQLDNNNQLVSEVKANAGNQADDNLQLQKQATESARAYAQLETKLEAQELLITELRAAASRNEEALKNTTSRYDQNQQKSNDEKNTLSNELSRLRQQLEDKVEQLTALTLEHKEFEKTEKELRATIAEQSAVIKLITQTNDDDSK